MENREEKQGYTIVKINTLSAEELAEIKLDDLWIFKPGEEIPSTARLCGCRKVCIV